MGQEIDTTRFTQRDFERFSEKLTKGTTRLADLISDQSFSTGSHIAGFEIEAWLVNQSGMPTPVNQVFIKQLNDPSSRTLHELTAFSFELNTIC